MLKDSWARLQAVAVSGSVSEGVLLAVLPLLAVTITTDPRQVSLVAVAGHAPWLLLSLFAGLLIDRVRRTKILVAAYAMQVCTAVLLGIAGSAHLLSLALLMIVAFAVTTSQVLGDGASGALVPEIVPQEMLTAANTRLLVLDRGVVQFVVPPLTGLLLGLGAGVPVWIAVVAAAVAALLARGLPSTSAGEGGRDHPLRDIAEGLRFLVATPLLRSITITVAIGSFASSAGAAMLVLWATQVLHLGPAGYGALLACMAAGWIACSFVSHRIVTRIGYSRSMRLGQGTVGVSQLIIAVSPAWPPVTGLALFLLTAAVLIWNICSQSVRQLFTPSRLLGRVLTSHRALAWGMTPIGALAGGFVAAQWSLRGVWVMVTILHLIATIIVWRSLSPAAFAKAEIGVRFGSNTTG